MGLQVAEVADGSGGAKLGGQGQGLCAHGAGPFGLPLVGVDVKSDATTAESRNSPGRSPKLLHPSSVTLTSPHG